MIMEGERSVMKHLDWQMIIFVGASLAHDYWIFWGLPRIYFYDMKQEHSKNNKAA